jgi:predicted MFS family arabinose efflux permease
LPATPRAPARPLVIELAAAALARLVLNTARRFAYPFAPALARGLEVPLTQVTSLVALNQGTGLLNPFLGPLADRWGPRAMMLIGLGSLAAGMLAAAALPFYATVLLALALAGLGKSCFDPALLAYVGARVPWVRRGLAIGLVEFAWAGSSLLGIPLVGYFIGRYGWRSPFFLLGALALGAFVLLALLLPRVRPAPSSTTRKVRMGEGWRILLRRRVAIGALGYSVCFSMANDTLFVIFGAWLERDFHLPLAALGEPWWRSAPASSWPRRSSPFSPIGWGSPEPPWAVSPSPRPRTSSCPWWRGHCPWPSPPSSWPFSLSSSPW